MVADNIRNFIDAFGRFGQKLCGFLKSDVLNVRGIGKSGLTFDQSVEVIFLIMKRIREIPDGYVGKLTLNVLRNFFKDNPVHGLSLFSGKGEFIPGAQNPEDAQQEPLADIV